MAEAASPQLIARIAQLEQDLKELRARVVALERSTGAGEMHPSDQATVRQKVAYDWQSPNRD